MTVNPMTAEVARLVGNLLAAGGEVWLPGVGSLYTERVGARRVTKRSVAPPCRVVSFTSQQRGVSLGDEIARVAQCSPAEGQEIYDRWLTRVQQNDVLSIEEVGVLRFKNFTLDAAFDKRLNPQGHTPVRIASRRGSDWVLWLGVVAILAAVGLFGYQYLPDYLHLNLRGTGASVEPYVSTAGESPLAPVAADTVASVPDSLVATPAEGTRTPDTTPITQSAAPQHAANATTPAPVSVGTADAPARFVVGRKYVVLGVFSTAANAARAVRDAAQKDATMQCGIYRFGEKFLVAAFDADDAEACTQFIRLKGDAFPGLWTYVAR